MAETYVKEYYFGANLILSKMNLRLFCFDTVILSRFLLYTQVSKMISPGVFLYLFLKNTTF